MKKCCKFDCRNAQEVKDFREAFKRLSRKDQIDRVRSMENYTYKYDRDTGYVKFLKKIPGIKRNMCRRSINHTLCSRDEHGYFLEKFFDIEKHLRVASQQMLDLFKNATGRPSPNTFYKMCVNAGIVPDMGFYSFARYLKELNFPPVEIVKVLGKRKQASRRTNDFFVEYKDGTFDPDWVSDYYARSHGKKAVDAFLLELDTLKFPIGFKMNLKFIVE